MFSWWASVSSSHPSGPGANSLRPGRGTCPFFAKESLPLRRAGFGRCFQNIPHPGYSSIRLLVIKTAKVKGVPQNNLLHHAKQSQIDKIIFGKYQASGEDVSVETRVVDVNTGNTEIKTQFRSDFKNLQREASNTVLEIATKLKASPEKEEISKVLSNKTSAIAWRVLSQAIAEALPFLIKNISFQKGGLAGSMKKIEQSISADPSYAEAWSRYGALCEKDGRRYRAFMAFKKALDIKPFLIEPNQRMGSLLMDMNQSEAGLILLKESVRLNPSLIDNYSELMRALINAGKKPECLSLSANLIRSSYVPAMNLGTPILFTLGDRATTQDELINALEIGKVKSRRYVIFELRKIGDSRSI
jgi:tetratricopeptide (TPR) repeat protein